MDFQVPQGVMPAGRGFGGGFGARGQLAKNASAPGGAAGAPGGTTQNSSAPKSPFEAPNPIEDPLAPGGGQQPESSMAQGMPLHADLGATTNIGAGPPMGKDGQLGVMSSPMDHRAAPPPQGTPVSSPPFSAPPAQGPGGPGGGSSFHPNWAFSPKMWAGSGQPNPQDIGKSFGSEIFQPLATGPHAAIPPPGGTPVPPTQGQPPAPSFGSRGDFAGKTLGGFSSPFQSAEGGWSK